MAFTAGFLKPAVYASKALMESAHPKELRLILAHELHHVKKKDPLKVWILSFLTLCFPWCPLFAWVKARFLEEAEIQADDAALKAVNDPRLLAKTLLRLSAQGAGMIAAFFSQGSQNSILARRVMRLLGLPKAKPKNQPPLVLLWSSFFFFGFLGFSPALAYVWRLYGEAWVLGCLCRISLA
jgi:beta-lactamase regulating signal transducer with metallopeptidase domain